MLIIVTRPALSSAKTFNRCFIQSIYNAESKWNPELLVNNYTNDRAHRLICLETAEEKKGQEMQHVKRTCEDRTEVDRLEPKSIRNAWFVVCLVNMEDR
ncbi:hypothetical protein ACTXT7_004698 [Hymenolepis weldensis]